jgi:hypothetical protein
MTKHPGFRTKSVLAASTHPGGGDGSVHHTRNRTGVVKVVPGTGKGHLTSPPTTHKKHGAIMGGRKARGALDNRD